MDSQFNNLTRSYSDNYVQYKITGNPTYQTAYQSAKQGLDTIIGKLNDQVTSGNNKISAFYKSGVEQRISELSTANKQLQRGIVAEKDDIEAAKMRGVQSMPTTISLSTWQYVTLGGLGAAILGLSLL